MEDEEEGGKQTDAGLIPTGRLSSISLLRKVFMWPRVGSRRFVGAVPLTREVVNCENYEHQKSFETKNILLFVLVIVPPTASV